MTRKIALLITLVMIFSISCIYASEAITDTLTGAPVESEPIAIEENQAVAPEQAEPEELSGELTTAPTEGIEPQTSPTEGTEPQVSGEDTTTETGTNTNSTVIGAVIAIVIVIAVIAIVYVLQKK